MSETYKKLDDDTLEITVTNVKKLKITRERAEFLKGRFQSEEAKYNNYLVELDK